MPDAPSPAIRIATLDDYRRYRHRLGASCTECARGGGLDLGVLIARLGRDYTPADHGGHIPGLVCSRCGSREVSVGLGRPGV